LQERAILREERLKVQAEHEALVELRRGLMQQLGAGRPGESFSTVITISPLFTVHYSPPVMTLEFEDNTMEFA